MNFSMTVIPMLALAMSGCATRSIKRGHVVMKISDRLAHVALLPKEVALGDHVELYHNKCDIKGVAGGDGGFGAQVCKKISTGHGIVKKVFDADYVEVEFPTGTTFTEGDTVEKHGH